MGSASAIPSPATMARISFSWSVRFSSWPPVGFGGEAGVATAAPVAIEFLSTALRALSISLTQCPTWWVTVSMGSSAARCRQASL